MTSRQPGGVKAGLIVGAGLLLTRLAMARNLRDVLIGVGGTAFEIGGVLFVDSKAKKLDLELENWTDRSDARSLALARAQAADDEFERRLKLVQVTEARISQIEQEIRVRTHRIGPEIAKAAAVAQLRAGYMEGVAENRAASVAPRERK